MKYLNRIKMHKTMETEVIKHLLKSLFLTIKMCTDFTMHVIWMNAIYAVSLANHPRAVVDAFHPLKTHQSY